MDGEGVRGPELKATWAQLTIRVEETVVTRVIDHRAKTTRDHLQLPLYPLAEWLVLNWWRLFYEPEAGSGTERAFIHRHSFVGAREGYAFPPLEIQSFGEQVRLRWSDKGRGHYPVEFLGDGQEWLPRQQVIEEFSELIDVVVHRLVEYDIRATVVEREWNRLRETDPEERQFCRAAASLGLDPYEVEDAVQTAILEAGELLPAELHAEYFLVADLGSLADDAREVLDAVRRAQGHHYDLERVKELRTRVVDDPVRHSDRPWNRGYKLASQVRDRLDLGQRPIDSSGGLERLFGLDPSGVVLENGLFNRDFAAVMAINDRDSPGFVLRQGAETSQRFHLSRALFEYLTGPAAGVALVTGAASDQQRASRAFAAELLAPAAGLRERLPARRYVGMEEIEDLAEQFGVQDLVVRHQIENHALAAVREHF